MCRSLSGYSVYIRQTCDDNQTLCWTSSDWGSGDRQQDSLRGESIHQRCRSALSRCNVNSPFPLDARDFRRMFECLRAQASSGIAIGIVQSIHARTSPLRCSLETRLGISQPPNTPLCQGPVSRPSGLGDSAISDLVANQRSFIDLMCCSINGSAIAMRCNAMRLLQERIAPKNHLDRDC